MSCSVACSGTRDDRRRKVRSHAHRRQRYSVAVAAPIHRQAELPRPGFRISSGRGLLRRSWQCRPLRHSHLPCARPPRRTRSSRRTLHDHSLADRAEAARRNCRARRTESQRAQHPWPPRVATLPHWPLIYAGALEGPDHLELARTVDAAAKAVQRFVARIDRATKR